MRASTCRTANDLFLRSCPAASDTYRVFDRSASDFNRGASSKLLIINVLVSGAVPHESTSQVTEKQVVYRKISRCQERNKRLKLRQNKANKKGDKRHGRPLLHAAQVSAAETASFTTRQMEEREATPLISKSCQNDIPARCSLHGCHRIYVHALPLASVEAGFKVRNTLPKHT